MIIAAKIPLDSLAVWQSLQMMTEKPPSQNAGSTRNLFAPGRSPATTASSAAAPKVEILEEEEEPYTLTCVCGVPEDDGSTIQCDGCDSWQHINCYYPDLPPSTVSDPAFNHTCTDCKPVWVDQPRAAKRMQQWLADRAAERAEREAIDRKSSAKRPPAKNPKKKPRPIDVQVNHGRDGGKHGSPNDHPQPASKKAKTSHRPSQSVSSQATKRSPQHAAARAQPSTMTTTTTTPHPHPLSPATTPPDLPDNFEIHTYSTGFCSLYNEPHVTIVHSNSFASLGISNTISLWLREPERMKQETGRTYGEVFEDLPIHASPRPRIRIETKNSVVEHGHGAALQWRFLSTDDPIQKDVPLIELNGVVGFQKDYCSDRSSYWAELTSPLPFVFFHPSLPLYIDTRNEGSEARYVRRSCKPNSQLATTILDGPGPEYRFWLVSDRAIAAGEQITLPWDFRLHKNFEARWLYLLGLGDESPKVDFTMTDDEYTAITEWVHRILSEYGGCACDLGSNCAFTRFHRHHLYAKSHAKAPAAKKKGGAKKPKSQAISPTSTGPATNSRAPSESRAEDGPDNDVRSGSERSKPPSRNRTPVRQGSFDQPGVLTELTDRDKRKVAMAEDTFRRMEQQPPPKKKKRAPDGAAAQAAPKKPKNMTTAASTTSPITATTTAAATTTATATAGIGAAMYADASTNTSRGQSGSPASPATSAAATTAVTFASPQQAAPAPSAISRPAYVDAAVQTDPGPGLVPGPLAPPRQRRRIVSLTQRFLANRCQVVIAEERRRNMSASERPSTLASASASMDVDSPGPSPRTSETPDMASSPTAPQQPTLVMDASGIDTSPLPHQGTVPTPAKPDSAVVPPSVRVKTQLHVQLPPVPLFNPAPASAGNLAPASANPSPFLQQSPLPASGTSPFGTFLGHSIPAPSPIKKKLSLSDYTRRNKGAGKVTASSGPGGGSRLSSEGSKSGERPSTADTDKTIDTEASG